MAALESLKPKLVRGKIKKYPDYFVFIIEETERSVTFPLKVLETLPLFNGKNQIKDIAINVYQSKERISFRQLVNLCHHLSTEELLENGHDVLAALEALGPKQSEPRLPNEKTDPVLKPLPRPTAQTANNNDGSGELFTHFTVEEIANSLSTLPLFQNISVNQLEFLAKNAKVREFRENIQVITQDSDSRQFFVLLSGEVGVYKRNSDQSKTFLAMLKPHSIFGEFAAFLDLKRTADVITETPVEALMVSIDELEDDEKRGITTLYSTLKERVVLTQSFGSSEIFDSLPKEILQLFISCGSTLNFQKGDVVIREGNLGNAFFFVISGGVEVLKKNQHLRQIEPGDFFGEIALIKRVPRTATVRCTHDSLVLRIRRGDFYEILCENLSLALYFEEKAEARFKEQVK